MFRKHVITFRRVANNRHLIPGARLAPGTGAEISAFPKLSASGSLDPAPATPNPGD